MNDAGIRELICISCPIGCRLSVKVSDSKVLDVSGNQCKRGIAYAENEISNPKRILTTTVKIRGGVIPQLPVRTKEPIPKHLIARAMQALSKCEAEAPVSLGDVIVRDLLGTGVDVVASRSVARAE